MRSFHALGILLMYPTEDTREGLRELRNVLRGEEMLSVSELETLVPLFSYLETAPMLDLQESYVNVFDRSPALSLHLFEHVYGENRDRGQALAELSDLYAASGLFLSQGETPDYLPAFLEFMSLTPEKEARRLLGEVGHILVLMHGRLQQRQSPYAAAMKVLCGLCEPEPEAFRVEEADKLNPDKEPDLETTWQEPEAFPNRSCGTTPATRQPKHVVIEETPHA